MSQMCFTDICDQMCLKYNMWVLVLSIFSTPQGKKPQFFQQKQKLMDKFGDHITDQVWPNYSALPMVAVMCKYAANWLLFSVSIFSRYHASSWCLSKKGFWQLPDCAQVWHISSFIDMCDQVWLILSIVTKRG